jgi:hypothetical protein
LPSPRTVVSNEISHPTRKLLRLLGPCFKTGREQHCKGVVPSSAANFSPGPSRGAVQPSAVTTARGGAVPAQPAHPESGSTTARPTCPETHRDRGQAAAQYFVNQTTHTSRWRHHTRTRAPGGCASSSFNPRVRVTHKHHRRKAQSRTPGPDRADLPPRAVTIVITVRRRWLGDQPRADPGSLGQKANSTAHHRSCCGFRGF